VRIPTSCLLKPRERFELPQRWANTAIFRLGQLRAAT
jgi:hypothetical protein